MYRFLVLSAVAIGIYFLYYTITYGSLFVLIIGLFLTSVLGWLAYRTKPKENSGSDKSSSSSDSENMEGGAYVSGADEIKKFKELADEGIITQEEFEAKKKQLLGL